MNLKSFGCSFIFGTELSDDVSDCMLDWSENGKWIRPSQLTWPALLAQNFGYDYQSRALPGIGNLQILETILTEIPKCNQDDVFVIQWTWIDRLDYENINRSDRDNFWNTMLPGDTDKNSQWYYKNIHSEYRDKLSSLIYIKTAIDTLQEKNIKFIMANLDDLIFDQTWHCNSAIEYLQNYVQPHITYFEGLNFLKWAKQKRFPVSETLHPLEAAHQAGFELIKSYNLV
jgi:hypothetical protein